MFYQNEKCLAFTSHASAELQERALRNKNKNAEIQHDSNCVMFLGSREQLEVGLSRTTGTGQLLVPSKMHTFVKEAKAGKNVVSGKEVVGNIGSLKSERKNVKTIRAKSNTSSVPLVSITK